LGAVDSTFLCWDLRVLLILHPGPQLQALNNLGYTVLFASDMPAAMQLYHLFANLVKMIIVDPPQGTLCFEQEACVRSTNNPAGIPAWKIFSYLWWTHVDNPLGPKWTLSPENVS
jgi:hypothetical protein